jgi:hypothetical protein
MNMIQSYIFAQLAVIGLLLAELLILKEHLAVGRVSAE